MGTVILGVTISLDGFCEDRSGSVGPLYPDLGVYDATVTMKDTIRNTGAVVMAWKEYAMAEDPDWFAGNYEFQVPIFVFTDIVPEKHPKETALLSFTFVTSGVVSAVRQAKAAAGDKDVSIIGSTATTRVCLIEGLADELDIDIIPVFLKGGFRPFDNLGDIPVGLERISVVGLPAGRTHLTFRVVR